MNENYTNGITIFELVDFMLEYDFIHTQYADPVEYLVWQFDLTESYTLGYDQVKLVVATILTNSTQGSSYEAFGEYMQMFMTTDVIKEMAIYTDAVNLRLYQLGMVSNEPSSDSFLYHYMMLDPSTHEYLDTLVSYVSVFDDPSNLDEYVLTLNQDELLMFTETMFILAT